MVPILSGQSNTRPIDFHFLLRRYLSKLIRSEVETTILNTLCRSQFGDDDELETFLQYLVSKGLKVVLTSNPITAVTHYNVETHQATDNVTNRASNCNITLISQEYNPPLTIARSNFLSPRSYHDAREYPTARLRQEEDPALLLRIHRLPFRPSTRPLIVSENSLACKNNMMSLRRIALHSV